MLRFSRLFVTASTVSSTAATTITTPTTETAPTSASGEESASTTTSSVAKTAKLFTKAREIDKRIDILPKLEEFEKKILVASSSSSEGKPSNSTINLYSAVAFTPSSEDSNSQRDISRFFALNFVKRLNHEINLPTSVITIEQRSSPTANREELDNLFDSHNNFKRYFSFNTKRLFGDMEGLTTMKKVAESLKGSREEMLKVSPDARQNVVVFFNDTQIPTPRNKNLSLTYAQNNNVMCAMRRSFALLEAFSIEEHIRKINQISPNVKNKKKKKAQQQQNSNSNVAEGQGVSSSSSSSSSSLLTVNIPPSFFVTKLLRSSHMNKVTEAAAKFYDEVHLITLDDIHYHGGGKTTGGGKGKNLERYLVGEMKGLSATSDEKNPEDQTKDKDNKEGSSCITSLLDIEPEVRKRAKITSMFSNLSLPPAEGEAAEWMCWGCLQRREGRTLKCPKCLK